MGLFSVYFAIDLRSPASTSGRPPALPQGTRGPSPLSPSSSPAELTVAERIATHTISMASIHGTLRSTGISGEYEIRCTNGQNRQL